jgi:hypothetical protein
LRGFFASCESLQFVCAQSLAFRELMLHISLASRLLLLSF